MLIKKIQASGIPFIYEDDLQSNVAKRMEIYQGSSKRNRIAAFINCGGSYANIGSSESILMIASICLGSKIDFCKISNITP